MNLLLRQKLLSLNISNFYVHTSLLCYTSFKDRLLELIKYTLPYNNFIFFVKQQTRLSAALITK